MLGGHPIDNGVSGRLSQRLSDPPRLGAGRIASSVETAHLALGPFRLPMQALQGGPVQVDLGGLSAPIPELRLPELRQGLLAWWQQNGRLALRHRLGRLPQACVGTTTRGGRFRWRIRLAKPRSSKEAIASQSRQLA